MDTGFTGEYSPLAHVYRLSSARLRTLLLLYACNLMWTGLVILVLFLMFRREPGWGIYSVSLLSLFAIWHTFRLLAWLRIRLVTSPAGIAYLGPGYRLFTPWENVAGMGEVKALAYGRPGFRRLAGLMLRQPAPRFNRHFWAPLVMRARDCSALFIPLNDFEARAGELAQALRGYLPATSSQPMQMVQPPEEGRQPQAQEQYAGVWVRAMAYSIDLVLHTVIDVIIIGGAVALSPNTPGVLGLVSVLLVVLIYFGYFIVLEATLGATLGKLALGLRVVKTDGTALTWSGALIRNLLRLVDGLFGCLVGAILMWTSPLNQRLGDRVAKTVVVMRPRTLPQI